MILRDERGPGYGRAFDDVLAELGSLPVEFRFWVCPNVFHARRTDEQGRPAPTVEWDGDVARCLFPGCTNTNASRSPRDGSATQEQGDV